MTTALRIPTRQYLFLDSVSWAEYERLLRIIGERRVRMTYDNGDLEIMTVSFGHENSGDLLGLFVRILASELGLSIRGGRTTTLRTKLKKKGLEPDNCYWITNEKKMRRKESWQWQDDPPPDLALEVEISRSALNRMSIYAALEVPEVWRYDGRRIRVSCLNADGEYQASEISLAFPVLSLDDLVRFLKQGANEDESVLFKQFTTWVRAEVLPRYEAWKQRGKKNGR